MSDDKPDNPPRALSERLGFLSPELSKRIVSGAALGAVGLALTYWSPLTFAVLMFVAAAAMSWEWGRMVRGPMPDTGMIIHLLAVFLAASLSATDMAGLGVASAFIGAIVVAALAIGTGRAQLSGVGVLYSSRISRDHFRAVERGCDGRCRLRRWPDDRRAETVAECIAE
jgi:phosphatidate cytidylyltransferase